MHIRHSPAYQEPSSTATREANTTDMAAPGENPLKAGDLETSISCDAQNKLSGKISATVVSNASAAQETDITADYLDSKGKVVASIQRKSS